MYQYLTKLRLAGMVAVLCAAVGTPAAVAQTISGCLTTDGKLKNFVLGGTSVDCPGSQIPVTLGVQGPPGPPGANGLVARMARTEPQGPPETRRGRSS